MGGTKKNKPKRKPKGKKRIKKPSNNARVITMTHENALSLLTQVARLYKGTAEDHEKLQAALAMVSTYHGEMMNCKKRIRELEEKIAELEDEFEEEEGPSEESEGDEEDLGLDESDDESEGDDEDSEEESDEEE